MPPISRRLPPPPVAQAQIRAQHVQTALARVHPPPLQAKRSELPPQHPVAPHVQNAIASVQRKAEPLASLDRKQNTPSRSASGQGAQAKQTSLPAPTAYDGLGENWILEGLRKGRTQVKVFIDPNIESSVGDKAAREVVEDLNATLRSLRAGLQLVLVARPGPYTIHVGSAYDVYNKNNKSIEDRHGLSHGPEPAKEPYTLVFRREVTLTRPELAMERSQDAYKNTLMHELLHHLGLGHAYTRVWRGGTPVSTYKIDGRKTQMVGDTENPQPEGLPESKDLRDAQYRGVPATDRAQLEKILRPYIRARPR